MYSVSKSPYASIVLCPASESSGKLSAPFLSLAIFAAKSLLLFAGSTLTAKSATASPFLSKLRSSANCRAQNGHQ